MSRVSQLALKRPHSKMFWFLLLISVSYWYCLPVVSQNFVRYSEIRGYDLLLLALGFVLFLRYQHRLSDLLKQNRAGRILIRFAGWATLTSVFTFWMAVSHNRPYWALVTSVFLFHLWGFVLAYCAFRIFVTTRKQCLIILDTFLILGTIQAVIISLQAVGILPLFWSELYSAYGADAFSGTLGPNRALPGHTMILVFAVATGYWRNPGTVGAYRLVLAGGAALTAILAIGVSGSRTSWIAFAAFCAIALFVLRPHPGILMLILLVMVGVIAVVPDTIEDRVTEIYEGRLTSKLDNVKNDDVVTKFEAIDAGRLKNWSAGINELARRPWLILLGGGFNNYRYLVGVDISAHNIYLTLAVEVGIIGLLLYLGWLQALWREAGRLTSIAQRLRRKRMKVFIPAEMRSLLIAMLVSLLGGELLYPYRPAFAFMGMFLMLSAILNHPALVLGTERIASLPRSQKARMSKPILKNRAA